MSTLDEWARERQAKSEARLAEARARSTAQDVKVSYNWSTWTENKDATIAQMDDGRWVCRLASPPQMPNAAFWDRSVPLSMLVHDIGTLSDLEAFDMKGFIAGTLTPLPPHARMSSYDQGDTVIITNSRLQGRVGEVIGVSRDSVTVQGYAGGPRGVWQVRPDCLAALFPDGDVMRYEEILPGPIRFPPGTLVGLLVSDPGPDPWLVTGWSQGAALLQSLTTTDRLTTRKRQLFRWPDHTSGRRHGQHQPLR